MHSLRFSVVEGEVDIHSQRKMMKIQKIAAKFIRINFPQLRVKMNEK